MRNSYYKEPTVEEKNELNNIILNHKDGNGGNKKLLLAIATLAIILIIVVAIMSRINSDSTENIPQAILPPEPDEPLFEPITVIEESSDASGKLERIAKKIKEESADSYDYIPPYEEESEVQEEELVIVEPVIPEPVVSKTVSKPKPKNSVRPTPVPSNGVTKGKYYLQVGSFAKFTPSKKFIDTITKYGYKYTYHQVIRGGKTINKVLVGPFNSEKEARKALPIIRKKIEPGAFLTKV